MSTSLTPRMGASLSLNGPAPRRDADGGAFRATAAGRRLQNELSLAGPTTAPGDPERGSPVRMRGAQLCLFSPEREAGEPMDLGGACGDDDVGMLAGSPLPPPPPLLSLCKENVESAENLLPPPPPPAAPAAAAGAPPPPATKTLDTAQLRASRPRPPPLLRRSASMFDGVPPRPMVDSPSMLKRKASDAPSPRRRAFGGGLATASLPRPMESAFRAPSAPPPEDGAAAAGAADDEELDGIGALPSVPPPLRRRAVSAAGALELDGDVPVHVPLLPTVASSKTPDVNVVTPDTVAALLRGEFDDRLASFVIVDCRYDYEHEGGHIRGALPINDPRELERQFLETPLERSTEVAILFHCEFSSHRAPKMLRHLRALDRKIHRVTYPALYYPELYLIGGGYKDLFEARPELCEPCAYVPMADERFNEQCRQWTASLRGSWKRHKSGSEALFRRSAPGIL